METLQQIQTQLGPMSWPLLISSLLTLMIISERLVHFVLNIRTSNTQHDINRQLNGIERSNNVAIEALSEQFRLQRPIQYQGVAMLLAHHSFNQALREDIAITWLQEKRRQLRSGLKLLSLIGVISPLLGLLGTVLGLIDMFAAMATTTGNIMPSDLAQGLGLAMRTTAAGLIIAVPAIIGSHLLGIWADQIIAKIEHQLNYANLWLEGVRVNTLSDRKACPDHAHLQPSKVVQS
ncbi:biopolymer transporter ExbB [Vibrio azureus]|uniref:MotA/TolQ/ExbB proton channel domain-containing protein n=1 Tax=Vibrio azureus NBRC 104587 TaxID=1219077 RepID=U3ALY5_9VIBR|nr:MotA/TolQ/ExbB proton channel family protein [Vibrio azureus]AUI87826.1 biopolymer transporter ExbB [Vibrio azureus]GAD74785.1 hypothetical protein VAZ01S_015_00290 [Vibrio azureus NBRC 104587]